MTDRVKCLDRLEQRVQTRKTGTTLLNKDERIALHFRGSSRSVFSRMQVLDLIDDARAEIVHQVTVKIAA